MIKLTIMHKTLIDSVQEFTNVLMGIRSFLYSSGDFHYVHLYPRPGSVILLVLPIADVEVWKLCLLGFWLLITLLRVCKKLGAQLYSSSILFENFANEAQLYKIQFLIVRKFLTFFLLQNGTLSLLPFPSSSSRMEILIFSHL